MLESFGMYGRSNLFAFRGPQGAASLEVNVYRLNPDGAWEVIGGSGASMGSGGYVISGDGSLEEAEGGVLALEIQEDHSIALHINSLAASPARRNRLRWRQKLWAAQCGFWMNLFPWSWGRSCRWLSCFMTAGAGWSFPAWRITSRRKNFLESTWFRR